MIEDFIDAELLSKTPKKQCFAGVLSNFVDLQVTVPWKSALMYVSKEKHLATISKESTIISRMLTLITSRIINLKMISLGLGNYFFILCKLSTKSISKIFPEPLSKSIDDFIINADLISDKFINEIKKIIQVITRDQWINPAIIIKFTTEPTLDSNSDACYSSSTIFYSSIFSLSTPIYSSSSTRKEQELL